MDDEQQGERIAKALARAGVGSRRDVERMIEEGRIHLHGKKLETPAMVITTLDGITVDGETVGAVADTKLWRMHKRRGTLTTHKDPEGRNTVFDQLPNHIGRVIAVGRLDMNTEGLLLLTNDGALARWLELPSTALIRRYRVRVHGHVNENALAALKDGVTIEGVHYDAIDAALERVQGTNAWLTVAIREGKNREVRRVMEYLGLTVNRLIRTHYGPFTLGTLNDGAVAAVPEKQLYDVLPEFFKNAPQSMVAPDKKRDPSKWAKAKPSTKVRLGRKGPSKRDLEAMEARGQAKGKSNERTGTSGRAASRGAGSERPGLDQRRQSRIADPAAKAPTMRKPRGPGEDDDKGQSSGRPARPAPSRRAKPTGSDVDRPVTGRTKPERTKPGRGTPERGTSDRDGAGRGNTGRGNSGRGNSGRGAKPGASGFGRGGAGGSGTGPGRGGPRGGKK